MGVDRSYVARNDASRQRLAARLDDLTANELLTQVDADWTVGGLLAHLAFWDRRVMYVLDMTERDHKLFIPQLDIIINDLSLHLWAAIPPREAARLAIEACAAVDQRLEDFPTELLAEVYAHNPRWVVRAMHRDAHLDEVEAALRGRLIMH